MEKLTFEHLHRVFRVFFFFGFFLIGFHSMQDWRATTKYGVTGKRRRKRSKGYTVGKLFRKSQRKKVSINSKPSVNGAIFYHCLSSVRYLWIGINISYIQELINAFLCYCNMNTKKFASYWRINFSIREKFLLRKNYASVTDWVSQCVKNPMLFKTLELNHNILMLFNIYFQIPLTLLQ